MWRDRAYGLVSSHQEGATGVIGRLGGVGLLVAARMGPVLRPPRCALVAGVGPEFLEVRRAVGHATERGTSAWSPHPVDSLASSPSAACSRPRRIRSPPQVGRNEHERSRRDVAPLCHARPVGLSRSPGVRCPRRSRPRIPRWDPVHDSMDLPAHRSARPSGQVIAPFHSDDSPVSTRGDGSVSRIPTFGAPNTSPDFARPFAQSRTVVAWVPRDP